MPKSVDKRRSNCLSAIALVLIVLQIVAGVAAVITVEICKHSLLKYVGKTERGEIELMLLFVDLFGVQLAIYYSCGFLLIKKCKQEPAAPNVATMLCIWHLFIIVAILNGLILSYALVQKEELLENSAEVALLRGLEVYYTDPEWRLTWDELQFHGQCCGVQTYKDWESSAWIEETSETGQESPCDTELISLVPFSCCKSGRENDCIENYVPYKTKGIWGQFPAINISALNTNGCLPIFQKNLQVLVLAILCICVAVLFFEVIILILMRVSFGRSQKNIGGSGDSECQTTIVVKCPQGYQCDVSPDSEFEEGEPEDQLHRKGCPCKERRKVCFENDDEFSPLLLH